MKRITLEIEMRRDRFGGRTMWCATLGQITGWGTTEAAAKTDLRTILEFRAKHPTPKVVHGPGGSVVLAHPAEQSAESVCLAIMRPNSDTPSGYTMEAIRGRTVLECARDHAEAIGS